MLVVGCGGLGGVGREGVREGMGSEGEGGGEWGKSEGVRM